jgi:hypothetical protein
MRIASVVSVVAILGLALGNLPAQVVNAPASAPTTRPAVRSIQGPEKKAGLDVYVVDSDYQASPANLYVLLPDKFDKAMKQYKVLYVLPCWGPSNDGMKEAKKLDLANKYDIICVGPDYVSMCWYADHPITPKMLYDSYLPEVVVPFIDKTYPTIAKPEGRILVGFSKSGIGAVSELLHHPDVFGRAGAWDAPLMENSTRTEYYGPQEYFTKNYYIPDLLTRQADIFKGKPARFAIAGFGFGQAPGNIQQCHQLMDKLGIPNYCDDTIRPHHEWGSGWLGPLVSVLMAEDMTKVAPLGPLTTPTRPARRPTSRPASATD